MTVHFVYCRGADPIAPKVAALSGMQYGVRHDHKAFADVFMLDINWQKYVWSDYLAKVQRYNPSLAMVNDYTHKVFHDQMLERAAQLRDLGVPHVMVCPKRAGLLADIPEWCIVALSVPTRSVKYGGWLPDGSEIAGRRVHLLGGSPKKQGEVISWVYAHGATVFSLDGNILGNMARLGKLLNSSAIWFKPARSFSLLAGSAYSARNAVRYLSGVLATSGGQDVIAI